MKRNRLLVLIITFILATGCYEKPLSTQDSILSNTKTPTPKTIAMITPSYTPTGQNTLSPKSTVTDRQIPSATSFTKTVTHLPTAIPHTVTPTPTILPTIQSVPGVITNCSSVFNEPPADFVSTGAIILDRWAEVHNTYSLHLETWKETQLNQPDERLFGMAVSPDNIWIAYLLSDISKTGSQKSRENLVIADFDNQIQRNIEWEKGWGSIRAWLDNQNIVIDIPPENIAGEPATLMILNIFTGNRKILKPDFPGIYSIPYVLYWRGWGETVYDSTFSRVM
jgi:hypothetical protein